MNIRKFWRLSCLTVASFFWASCSESNPQFPMAQAANPDSSADANGGGLDDESSSSAVAPESSSAAEIESGSADTPPPPSSSSTVSEMSSSSETPSLGSSSSLIAGSSSSAASYILARDPSVTCYANSYMGTTACSSTKDISCEDYKKYLGSDTTLSEKIISRWESALQSCGAVKDLFREETLYGISYGGCPRRMFVDMKCSNDSSYSDVILDGKNFYTSQKEYDVAHGVAPDVVVKNCPQGDFALFTDVLADVQKKLYEIVSEKFMQDIVRSENEQKYLESLLDGENKTLKGRLAPYTEDSGEGNDSRLRMYSGYWFDGYIAKTKTCEDGTPVITERYQEKYDAILAECLELIEKELKKAE
ncbi:hypothetical protein [Fibrobacter sp. UWB12]|uniref:hypothetical protein n=1 Tax=Fibrobacter sp. UWB12 TaxID=1896203 RepID=UPI0009230BC2|nr:hypothetical protein [Fibrobacter sp. UWB12]SHK23343.1 hypothetical protein SAMN05720759_101259 [Fibrobacter sp. UWB12]